MIHKFLNYMRRTIKNKLMAILLIIIGFLTWLFSGDGTGFVFTLIFGIPLFFMNKKYV